LPRVTGSGRFAPAETFCPLLPIAFPLPFLPSSPSFSPPPFSQACPGCQRQGHCFPWHDDC